jgi:hypothetical protein
MDENKNDDDFDNDPVVKLLKINMLLVDFNDAFMNEDLDLINEVIKNIRTKLIFLESTECRRALVKDIIENEKKDATNRFKLLIQKRHKLLNMSCESSSEEE